MHMNFYAWSALINASISIILGSIVIWKSPRSKTHQLYLLLMVVLGLYNIAYLLWQVTGSAHNALFWSRGLMAAAIFIPVVFLHYTFLLINITTQKNSIRFGYFFSLLSLVADFTPYFVTSVSQSFFSLFGQIRECSFILFSRFGLAMLSIRQSFYSNIMVLHLKIKKQSSSTLLSA